MSSFTDLLPEKVMRQWSDVLLPEPEGYHHHEGRNILKVAGSKQSANGITDIFILTVSPVRTGILRRAAPTATPEGLRNEYLSLRTLQHRIRWAAKQQRRYEQLFHRHRYYAFS